MEEETSVSIVPVNGEGDHVGELLLLDKMENAGVVGAEEDDQKEEEKMDKFFALIRSYREARARRRAELNELALNNDNNKKKRKCNNEESSWVPSFEWEDFTQEFEFNRLKCCITKSITKKDGEKEEHEEGGLDLKLTL